MNLIIGLGFILAALGLYFPLAYLKFAGEAVILLGCWKKYEDRLSEGSAKEILQLVTLLFVVTLSFFDFIFFGASLLIVYFYAKKFRRLIDEEKSKKKKFEETEREIMAEKNKIKEEESIKRNILVKEEEISRSLRKILFSLDKDEIIGLMQEAINRYSFSSAPIPEFTIKNEEIIANRELTPAEKKEFAPFIGQAKLALLRAIRLETLKKVSRSDMLTGLPNRKALDEAVILEKNRAEALKLPLTYLMLDIDFFKKCNDTYGHLAGDCVLSRIADIIRNTARKSDFAARYGGEEFCILLMETDIENAVTFAERLRISIAETDLFLPGYSSPIRITVSLGLSDRSIEDADKALYISKNSGRNKVTVA